MMLLARAGLSARCMRRAASLSCTVSIATRACSHATSGSNSCASSTFTLSSSRLNHLNAKQLRKCQPMMLARRYASDLPKHLEVPLPALSPTMEKGNIKSWAKNEGDKLDEGDLLALIETDKATMDFETPQPGYLAKIVVPGGTQDVPLGKLLCIIVDNEKDVAAFKDFKADAAKGSSGAAKKSGDGELKDSGTKKPKENDQNDAKPAEKAKKQESKSAASAGDSGGGGGGNYPNHKVITLPALSPTVEKSTIKTWEKKEGDKIGEGDLIATVETDKATIDWTYEDSEPAFMAKILVPTGTSDVLVGQPVCVFVSNQGDAKAFADFKAPSSGGGQAESAPKKDAGQPKQQKPQQEQSAALQRQAKPDAEPQRRQQPADDQQAQQQGERRDDGRVFASPYARKIASGRGYDVSNITGSGPGGRVVAADVENFDPLKQSQGRPAVAAAGKQQAGAAPSTRQPLRTARDSSEPYTDIPVSNVRGIIAKRLLESKQQIPHYYLSIDVEMNDVMRIRQRLNTELKNDGIKLSLNDFVIKAAAHSCIRVPQCNSSWMGQAIRQFNTVDVSVAVSTDNGLITPIVFDADAKGLAQISSDVAALGKKARDGKLKPHEFQGGSFTVSNLGMFGTKNFSAIINPPQACILAVGGVEKRLLPDADEPEDLDKIRVAAVMSVTLCCDHRVVDGAVGAQWLQNFKRFLESPATMLL